MKRIVRAPNTEISAPAQPLASPVDELPDFDLERLLAQGGAILSREMRNLMISSAGGKLSRDEANALVNYIKLLSELKAEEELRLSELTDEELEKRTKD